MRPALTALALFPFALAASAAPAADSHPFAPAIMKAYTAENTPMPAVPPGISPTPGFSLQQEWLSAHVLPAPRQVAWQRLGFIAFVHFGPNTFTGREWGTGTESPADFAPKSVDARQWVRSLKAAGAKMVVLTTKHHDGFCLWPSRYTDQSVKNSPWKGGQGDLVREVADAAKAEGLKLGLYLSPADLHAIHLGTYGKTPVKPGIIPTPVPGWTPKSPVTIRGNWDTYNTYFMNQLFELLTEYGEVNEVWFDGANPHDVGQRYAYADWYKLIRTLQPKAVIFGKGPDARWIGNEHGHTRPNEWNALPTDSHESFNDRMGGDLGSRSAIAGAETLFWHPGETDVSIRPGWFYHAAEDARLHSLDALLDMWYGAVGGNAVLILNVPPATTGRIADGDVARLAELGRVIDATFATNLAAGAKVSASPAARTGESDTTLLDGDTATGWAPADWQRTGELTFTLPSKRTFNRVSLAENITRYGQRVERHAVDAWVDGAWKTLKEHGTIGARRIHRTDTLTTDRVRVRFLDSRVCPSLAEFGLFYEPARLAAPAISRDRAGLVTLTLPARVTARVTTDGTAPGKDSPLYTGPFALPRGGVVRARSEAASGGATLAVGDPETTVEYGPAKAKWKVVSVSSEETSAEPTGAANAIDDNPETLWHTAWKGGAPKPPHTLVVDMGETLDLRALTYLPRTAGPFVRDYAFAISTDGTTWTEVSRGEFGNIRNNPIRRTVEFTPAHARYFKFTALREDENKPFISAAEIGVLVK